MKFNFAEALIRKNETPLLQSHSQETTESTNEPDAVTDLSSPSPVVLETQSLKECFSRICENDEFVRNCVRNRESS